MKKVIYVFLISVPFLILSFSCSTVREHLPWGKNKNNQMSSQEHVSEHIKAPTKDDYIADLKKIIDNEIKLSSTADRNKVYRRRPYYWKNYATYDTQEPQIDIQETDIKSKPYIARVKLNKIFYYTKLHKNRRDAEEDKNFIRSVGVETLTYELRNGRWMKIGSTFIPDKTEKYEGNQWIPIREEEVVKEQSLEQPKEGFFKRLRSWIF